MHLSATILDSVITVIVRTLQIADRKSVLNAESLLFGTMPELDSLALLELAMALEDRFGITIEDEEFTEEVFNSIGSLAHFVEHRLSSAP